MLSLQPAWRKLSTNPVVRCENGDPFTLLLEQVETLMINFAESAVNSLIKVANGVIAKIAFGWRPFKRYCMPNRHVPDKCDFAIWDHARAHFSECESVSLSRGADNLCYYQRVHTICTSDDNIADYTKLFAKGFEDVDSLRQEFASAFGDSFDFLDPTLASLLEEVQRSTESGPDLADRREICASAAFASSLRLDEIIVSCIFAMAESNCSFLRI
jgi:hypothetical protein